MMTRRQAGVAKVVALLLTLLAAPMARSQTPYLVADLNTVGMSAEPRGSTTVGDYVFFSALDETGAFAMFRTDGTPPGTVRLAAMEGAAAATLQMTAVGTTLFYANRPAAAPELWRSDGTPAGTVLVHAFAQPGGIALARAVGTRVFFVAPSAGGGTALWTSDGTEAGTQEVLGVPAPTIDAVVAGGLYYFVASDAAFGQELWRSDGTTAGTVRITDVRSGPTGSSVSGLTTAGGLIYFVANDGTGSGVWQTDGTPGVGTRVHAATAPSELTAVGTGVFFTGTVTGMGRVLLRSFGTPATTTAVAANMTGTPGAFFDAGGVLLFNYQTKLWKSDGTPGGTERVVPSGGPSPTGAYVRAGAQVYFVGSDPAHDREMWRTDGTAAGTVLVADINPGTFASSPSDLAALGDVAIYAANDSPERELWRSDLSGTTRLTNLGVQGTADSNPRALTPAGSSLALLADDGLWRTDGTPAGTQLVREAGTGSSFSDLAELQDAVYASRSGSPQGVEREDGTSLFDAASVWSLWRAGDHVYFHDELDGVWATSGAVATKIASIPPFEVCTLMSCFEFSVQPRNFTDIGATTLFLTANALWRTNGTAAGTSFVASIAPNTDPISPTPIPITPLGGFGYFATGPADLAPEGVELWRSDGTPEGTARVADVWPGSSSSDPREITVANGVLYFAATEPTGGRELWRSDGTAAGTTRVVDLNPGAASADPTSLAVLNGLLYFAATDGVGGRELWRTDGTAAGTSRVADIVPGADGSNPTGMRALAGRLYFSAADAAGRELWRSDGSEAGTAPLGDLNPGPADALPDEITLAGSTVYFTATTPLYGRELWAVTACEEGDADMDGICDGDDPCVGPASDALAGLRVTLSGLGAPAGRQRLKLKGVLTVPTTPAIDPAAGGLRLLVRGATGLTLLDLDLAGGAGWTVRGATVRAWRYRAPDGSVVAKVRGNPAVGELGVDVRAKGTIAASAASAPLRATVAVDAGGQCGEHPFAAAACRVSAKSIACK